MPPSPILKRLALPVVFLLGLALRLWDLGQPFLGDNAWNETFYATIGRTFLQQGQFLTQPDISYGGQPVLSSPFVPWLVYAAFRLFGLHEWAARLPMLLCGLLSLGLFYLLVRQLFNTRVGWVAALLTASAPGIVFFSRNVQLDSPMLAAGLGALLALAYYRAKPHGYWWLLGLACFALAILAKYTAVLFWPALTWLWFSGDSGWRNKRHWLGWAAFTALAMLPSMIWLTYAYGHLGAPTAGASANHYFLRFDQWNTGAFKDAALSLWPRLLLQLGPAILIPSVAAGVLRLAQARSFKLSGSAVFVILLIAPWYLQLVYPQAWVDNPYYEYAALYGLCLVGALAAVAGYDYFLQVTQLSAQRQGVLASALGLLLVFVNFWSYRDTYHRSYYPWPLVVQAQPFDSARAVAALNSGKEPVLADVAMTLYYSEADLSNSKYLWWARGDKDMIEAITSCQYRFVVFEYPPTIATLTAIQQSGYQPIAPAAWQKGKICSAG